MSPRLILCVSLYTRPVGLCTGTGIDRWVDVVTGSHMGAARPQHKSGSSFLTSGRHCIAAGNGLSGGVAGVAAIVSVRARDARAEVCFRTRVFAFPHSLNSPLSLAFFEQPRTKGGDVVLVCMTPEGGMSADAHVIDDGVLDVRSRARLLAAAASWLPPAEPWRRGVEG